MRAYFIVVTLYVLSSTSRSVRKANPARIYMTRNGRVDKCIRSPDWLSSDVASTALNELDEAKHGHFCTAFILHCWHVLSHSCPNSFEYYIDQICQIEQDYLSNFA